MRDPISADLMKRIFDGLPTDSKLIMIHREYNHATYVDVSYLVIECPAFKEQPTTAKIDKIPTIDVFFMRDGNGKVYISGMDFTRAMGMNAVPPPPPVRCQPAYKKYVGLNEVYNYCAHCGKKEGEHP